MVGISDFESGPDLTFQTDVVNYVCFVGGRFSDRPDGRHDVAAKPWATI